VAIEAAADMKKQWLALSTGFAFFSMFFGSGNLVFPISVGQQGGGHYLLASLGIFLTGVVVPFLGVLGMALHRGEVEDFFRYLGKAGTLIFSLFALSLLGPFGVVARCLTVVHGALQLILPQVPLLATSLVLCVLIFFLTVNRNRIVGIMGALLTPFLLISIGTIALFGLRQGTLPAAPSDEAFAAFRNGFFQGYQTMDLLAAFFLSSFVIKHLQSAAPTSPLRTFLKAALIGGGMLALVYLALVLLGAIYGPILVQTPPQEMLGRIALAALGAWAAPVVCVAVVLACLTTAIVLTSLFADFVRTEIVRNRISSKQALLLTLAIGFLVSTLQFSGIAKFLGPILEMSYPALIVLTCVATFHRLWQLKRQAT
jgi:branched-chain amino acid:cation transporter, LIVCS family